MYLPGHYTVSEVQEADQMTLLRRHFSLYYKIIVEAKCVPEAQVCTTSGVVRYYSGLPNPFCNVVIGLPKSSWDEEIQRHIAYFEKHAQSFAWYVDLKANPYFKEDLIRNGFKKVGVFQGVIGKLEASYTVAALDEGVTIELVQDEATMCACIELIGSIFHVSKDYKKAMESTDTLYTWAAKKDGEVVSCLTTLIDGGLVSFWNGATLPEYRRQGLSTALRKTALNHAVAKGCHTGSSYLMAEAMALGICKSLGYQSKWQFEVFLRE